MLYNNNIIAHNQHAHNTTIVFLFFYISTITNSGLAAFDTIPIQGTFAVFHFIGLLELGFNSCKDEVEEFCAEKSGFSQDTMAYVI